MIKTNRWGIDDRFKDGTGTWHDVSPDTHAALHAAMGADEQEGPHEPPLLMVYENVQKSLEYPCDLVLEDGAAFSAITQLPEGLPLGYHTLRNCESGSEIRLIVAPKKCFLPEPFHIWGWTLQLYAMRSQNSWGMGDLEDLRCFSDWSVSRFGSRIVMVNPLDAAAPVGTQQPSPYFPSSRLFRNPLYLRVELVPGANEAPVNLEFLANQGRDLNANNFIDRDAIFRLKMEGLSRIWDHTKDHVKLSSYEKEAGSKLDLFAAYCVLAEQHGANFREWPEQYSRPDSSAVRALIAENSDRLRFHKWLQSLTDAQLKLAAEAGAIMQDLPVGVDPDGADAWMWSDTFAQGVSVGAPPDPFSAEGQDWGLPPFIPHKLRQACYEPFIHTVRSAMRHSKGLRIDHVMGLFRLFWLTKVDGKKSGAYVRYNADEMLSILALESVRAQAFLVGEDLGTVEDGVREKLAGTDVLSYRVLWFEEEPPASYPQLALAAATTHDLPTIAGAWTGADLEEQRKAGLDPDQQAAEKTRNHLRMIAGVDENAPVSEVIVKTHEALAQAPSAVVVASLDDALGVEQRPNLPGLTSERRPNWCIPLPKTLEDIQTDATVLQIAGILRR